MWLRLPRQKPFASSLGTERMTRTVKKNAALTPISDKKRVPVKIDEKPTFRLHVDADRDGKVDDDPNGLEVWTWGKGKRGAVVLVNNNSNVGPPKIDHEDSILNGGGDLKDIAALDIRRTGPTPPGGYRVTLSVSAAHAKCIRIFDSRTASGSEIIGPSKGEKYMFPSADFVKKELGIEAVRYAGDGFDGLVTITLSVDNGGTPAQKNHVAAMRVAPWIMFNHFDKPEKIFAVETGDNAAFLTAVEAAAGTVGVPLKKTSGPDRWMQDIMEFGYSHLPGNDALRNVLETPRGRRLAGYPKTLVTDVLGYTMPAAVPARPSSLNSGGNLECTPPFKTSKGKDYPFGRMYFCSARADKPKDGLPAEYVKFLLAQAVQEPIEIDAGWLTVGHVDEIISFVPANNKLGFKLLLASPKLGLQLLADAGKKGASLLSGVNYVESVPATIRASDLLTKGVDWVFPADARLAYTMTGKEFQDYNKACQTRIDRAEEKFKEAIGLTSTDIAYVPSLYVHLIPATDPDLRADALTAGMVNMLVLDKACIAPKPFGPVVGGKDLFEEHYRATLADCGLTVTFVDDWETYHVLKGEVHCGSNTLRKVDPNKKWWEFLR
jgi:Protein-arginine deiminase (PAD)/Protein-arginine deiminase (PAD) middle domain